MRSSRSTANQNVQQKVKMLTEELRELELEMTSNQEKQSELLSFTSKLTEKNTQLQSENSTINERLQSIEGELKTRIEQYESMELTTKQTSQTVNANLSEELKKNEKLMAELENCNKQVIYFKIRIF